MKNILDLAANGTVGFIGVKITLENANSFVGLLAGLGTFAWMVVKIYYTIKNKGK